MQDRVSTGIKKLDQTIEGGFKRESMNLLEGGPGTGKSIFGLQFLISGIENGENGVFITFEEGKAKFMDNMSRFGWNLENLEKQGKLCILEFTPEDIKKAVEKKSLALKFVVMREMKAKRIVIDSITAYSLLFDDGLERRRALRGLFKVLMEYGCTSLLISEKDVNPNDTSSEASEFEADSVIMLYNLRNSDIRERALEVKKMRGTKIQAKLFPMQITEKGIEIFPDQAFF